MRYLLRFVYWYSTTFYKEGKRAVGLQILEMVGIEVYLKTLRENMEGSNG